MRVTSFSNTSTRSGPIGAPPSASTSVRTRRRLHGHRAPRPRREHRGALCLARVDRALRLGVGGIGVAGGAEHRGEREPRVGDEQQRVGRRREFDGLPCERQRARGVAPPGGGLGADVAPRDAGLEVGAGEPLGVGRDLVGLVDAALQQQRAAEERARLRRLTVEAAVAQLVVRGAEIGLGRAGLAVEQLDEAGRDLGFQSPVGEAELFDRPAAPTRSSGARRSTRPRSASSTAWHRSATDSTAGAPAVMRNTRTTSRQRPLARVTGLGPHRAAGGASARIVLARRGSPAPRAAASAASSARSAAPIWPRRSSAAA